MPAASARLFVALELPAAVRDALVAWRAPLLADAGGAPRGVDPAALHVTLCFLGTHPLDAIEGVGEALVRALGAAPPAPGTQTLGAAPPAPGAHEIASAPHVGGLALGDPLWLPRRRPRSLAVAIADADGALAAVQAAVADALVAGGWLAPETRPFLPHVTVARLRGSAPAGPGRALTSDPLPAPPALAFAGTAVTLYRSHIGGGPARYERLVRVLLR